MAVFRLIDHGKLAKIERREASAKARRKTAEKEPETSQKDAGSAALRDHPVGASLPLQPLPTIESESNTAVNFLEVNSKSFFKGFPGVTKSQVTSRSRRLRRRAAAAERNDGRRRRTGASARADGRRRADDDADGRRRCRAERADG